MEESYRRLKNDVYPINLFVLSFIGMKSIFYDQISAKLLNKWSQIVCIAQCYAM